MDSVLGGKHLEKFGEQIPRDRATITGSGAYVVDRGNFAGEGFLRRAQ